MNPLTQVKNTQKITAREAALGVSEAGSWHAKYKDSAYVYAGNFSFDLTEGDLLAIFAQYGEIVDINLVRDKGTGKSRGFAFLAYEDQRSTVLAVDNLNGASVVGRTIKVDHVANYKKKAEEDEEEEQRKREERGVCRAFQRGECNRGAACKFSHDEKRSANTGWGSKDDAAKWTHDKYDRASQQEQGHRSRDESGSRRDGSSRPKGREDADFLHGRRGDAGHKLQESERLELKSGSAAHNSRGYTSRDRTGNQHDDDRRGSGRREQGPHRGYTDRKVRRDGADDNTELRDSDDEHRKNQRDRRSKTERESEERDHRQRREWDIDRKDRNADDAEHGRRDDERRGQDHRKSRRDERGYDSRHNGGGDYSVLQRGRGEDEEIRSKARRHDSEGESSEDRDHSRPSRRSHRDTGVRDIRDKARE